jgi:hypothetical protein
MLAVLLPVAAAVALAACGGGDVTAQGSPAPATSAPKGIAGP